MIGSEAKLMIPRVAVVILTYNGRSNLECCLPSLARTNYPNYEVIVVDNGSTDGSADYVREAFPSFTVIVSPKNRGYSGGNNLGIRLALERDADYVLILNDDTAAVDPDWLTRAVAVAEGDRRIALVGFQETAFDHPHEPQENAIYEAQPRTIVGFAMLVRARALRDVGLFDEGFFLTCEEDDLQIRLVRSGWRLVGTNIPVAHRGSASMGKVRMRAAYHQIRGRVRLAIKHDPWWRVPLSLLATLDVCCNPVSVRFDPRDAAHRRMRRTGYPFVNPLIWLAAVLWNIAHLRATVRARREVARLRGTGDATGRML